MDSAQANAAFSCSAKKGDSRQTGNESRRCCRSPCGRASREVGAIATSVNLGNPCFDQGTRFGFDPKLCLCLHDRPKLRDEIRLGGEVKPSILS